MVDSVIIQQLAVGGPISTPALWDYFTVNGIVSPGIISIGGIKGFKRDLVWDVKTGKGSVGATPTLTNKPLIKGSFTIQLWTDEQIQLDWPAFISGLNYDTTKSSVVACTLGHPALAAIEFTTAVCEYITPVTHKGGNLYEVEIGFMEYRKPPPDNATSTPSKANTSPSSNDTPFGPPIDAANDEAKLYAVKQQRAAFVQGSRIGSNNTAIGPVL